MKKTFSTSDLPSAVFLKMQGLVILKVTKEGPRATITFGDTEKRGSLLLQFFNKQTQVEPLAFLEEIRNLKALIRQ